MEASKINFGTPRVKFLTKAVFLRKKKRNKQNQNQKTKTVCYSSVRFVFNEG